MTHYPKIPTPPLPPQLGRLVGSPGRRGMLALGTLIASGVVGFMLIEGWGPLDAIWMVIITMTTIGYGEVHPLSPAGRVFTIAFIIAGVSVGAYVTSWLTRELIEGGLERALEARRTKRQMENLSNHFILVGFGRLGRAVAEELRQSGEQIVIIDKHPVDMDVPHIVGDGADDAILRQAGIERARGLAVAVSAMADAVFVTLSARQLAPNLYIITRADDPKEAQKAKRAGADAVISPHTMGGFRIAHGLLRPHSTSFLDLATLASHSDVELDEFHVQAGALVIGKTLREIDPRSHLGVLVLAIRRKSGQLIPAPGPEIRLDLGDVAIVMGAPAGVASFAKVLEGPAS
ncbi:MAG: potassium channel protein [Myxococcota bacterium]